MVKWKGFVSRITYRNEENYYTVFEVTCTEAAGGGEDAEDASNASDRPAIGVGDEVTCVGYPVSIGEGESCEVAGDFVAHPVYGDQVRLQSYRAVAPEGAQAMYRYLAAGAIKGVRQALAKKIVARFGDDTLRVMEEEPERLTSIKGISMRIAREIGAQMEEKKDLRDAMLFLQKYGIGGAHAARIWDKYGTELYTILQTNPYRLAEEIRGIGFATADEIARRIGIRADSEYRIRSGILYTLFLATGEGHSYLPQEELARRTRGLLGLPVEEILLQMENLAADRRLRIRCGPAAQDGPPQVSGLPGGAGEDLPQADGGWMAVRPREASPEPEVYLAGAYREEAAIAHMLAGLDMELQLPGGPGERAGRGPGGRMAGEPIRDGKKAACPDRKKEGPGGILEEKIARLEAEEGISLDPLQREAVAAAAARAVLILSGGPGTGKTTTIRAIIRLFCEEGLEVVLAAPTGRAARRMAEATGREAMTIHRLLGVRSLGEDEKDVLSGSGGRILAGEPFFREGKKENVSCFERNGDNPLEADAVIIDEMSMVDMHLFHALLSALPPGTRLVMVGDANQLPSVGPGQVLQDLMGSGCFKTVVLRHIFRQAKESDIVMNAHRILEGAPLAMDNRSRDFFFLERGQAPVIYKHLVQMIREMLPKYLGCRPEEIQVLTPMRRGNLGVEQLNVALQAVLNPPAAAKREYRRQETVYREGDKVMQTRNNYQMAWELRGNFGMPLDRGTGIFNGDFGRIERIDPRAESMTIVFEEDRTVDYPFSDLEDLDLAYAITVHKSQGSEYPAVLLPILGGPSGLFNRNLLYTAVTRAKKCVVLMGSREAVEKMAANTRRARRYTGLRDRIREAGATGIASEQVLGF